MVYLQECIRTQKKCPGCNVDHDKNKTYLAEGDASFTGMVNVMAVSAGLLLRFALPLFIGNLLQQFYNLADTSMSRPYVRRPGTG